MESQFDLGRYLSILKRRWLYLVVPAVIIAIGSVVFAYTATPVYQASATILVESQQIPTDLASPTVTSDAAERIRVIEQRLLARNNLLDIAGKYALFQYLGAGQSPTAIVENVRKSIQINQIDTSANTSSNRVVGFTVKFEYRDPATAARVTNDLVASILSQNVESRLNRASETSEFFAQQKNSLEQRLLALENKIAEFKRTNQNELPETLEIRREQYTQIRLQIGELDQRIRVAQDPDGIGLLSSDTSSLKQLEFRLQGQELSLQDLQDQRAELAPLAEKGFVPSNRMRDIDRQIALAELDIESIKTQIQSSGGALGGDSEVRLLEARRGELEEQAKLLNDSILETPLIQVEINSMDREYENLQSEYRIAQTKLEGAQTGERLEQDRQSERFEVIEQASVPDEPTSPNQPRILMLGFAGGIAAGAGLMVLRNLLDGAVYSAADIERALHLRPIAVVPYVMTEKQKRRSRLILILAIAGAIIAIIVALALVHIFYQPLDILTQKVMDRAHNFLAQRGVVL